MLARLPPSPVLLASTSEAGPSSPIPRHRHAHKPASPSPLSPNRARTPRSVAVGKKRKTPLSRLVLEKAVRQRSREAATSSEQERPQASVLTEGGRLGNDAKPQPKATGMKPSTLGGGHSRPPSLGSALGGNTLKSSPNLAASTSAGAAGAPRSSSGDTREIRRSTIGRDLSKADGIGPKAAAKAKVWR
jgi:hypothetical protein